MTSADAQPDRDLPLVSCIMPTYNRRPFVARAIDLFLRQDYPRTELLVVDDGSDCVRDLMPADERVRYIRLSRRATVGAKRNLACEHARGLVIAHWDDDDWHAPHRLSYQVRSLLAAGADLAGIDTLLFYDVRTGRAWQYRYGAAARRWLSGSSLCYRRALWERHRFANTNVGEDSRFVWAAKGAKLLVHPDPTFHVGLIHHRNVSPKQTSGSHWRPYPLDDLRRVLGPDWDRFARPAPERAAVTVPSDPGRVTVSIPYARCRAYVVQAVESILAQTYTNLRLVVVNDGDPEPPWDLLAHLDDPRLLRFDLPGNHGRYFADAVVVEATPDPHFLVQDADDWSAPERIETLLAAMRAEQAIGAVSAAFNHHHQQSEQRVTMKDYFPLRGQPLTADNLHRLNHHGLFDVAALRRVGGYYGGQRIGYDTLLGNLLLMTGHVAYVERPVYHRRLRGGSLCTSPDTGMGTPARRAASEALQVMYDEAFRHYTAHLRGTIDRERLGARIRQVRDRHVTPAERALLQREAARLRALMAEQDRRWAAAPAAFLPRPAEPAARPGEPAPAEPATAAVVPRPAGPERPAAAHPPLVEDRRLTWDDWTISRPLATALADRLDRRAPRRVLELGSGLSTLVLAEYAARSGAAVVSLEHDPRYHERTERLLVSFGLRARVDLRLAPLAPLACADGRRYPWYRAALDGPFDFVFVDGPPLKHGRQAALFALASALAPDWELWLKDGHRSHEQACLALWQTYLALDGALYDEIDRRGVWVLWPAGRSSDAAPSWPAARLLGPPVVPPVSPRPASASPGPAAGRAADLAPRVAVLAEPGQLTLAAPAGSTLPPPPPSPDDGRLPLVSCVMPTYNRRRFVPQALALFLRQDYPRRELLVVDDGSDPVGDLIPGDPRIRYLRLTGQRSIGSKRNLACEQARGEIILLWDDDDWYADNRISYQAAPLLAGRADADGLAESLVMDLPTARFWRCTTTLHNRMFVHGIVSGTLAFRRCYWEQGARFPHVSLAEDAAFQRELVRRGARLERLPNPHHFVYVRHGTNSWQFRTGQFLDRRGWQAVTPPAFIPAQDLAFYRALHRA